MIACFKEESKSLYPLIFGAGVIASALWLATQQPQHLPASRARDMDLLPALTAALAGGFICARLGYVLTYHAYFSENPIQSLWLWQGGLSGAGGLLGACIGIGVYARWTRLPFKQISDELALPGLILAACSWIGCWLEGSVYGMRLDFELPLLTTRDMFGNLAARWPAALIGLIPALGALFVLTRRGVHRWRPGCQASLAGSAAALGMLLASLVRADPLPILFDLRLDTLAGLFTTIAGLSALLLCFRSARKSV